MCLNLYLFAQAFRECIAKCFNKNLLGLVNMNASTGLYEPYRLNRKKKARGQTEEGGRKRRRRRREQIKRGDIQQ